ncbi:carboxypeptidase [Lentzea tibetensis]|uniref:Zinc carboxypeptidase n=1 Tax=Lentzea tibetensis TaxID=2591470 RepID=A0A563F016_9PSEU|nr:M14 family zinc carboxypeptidase [Lentzea tibetensis]TWP53327.1 carboxypeptidase [Lentzea tibetensis]
MRRKPLALLVAGVTSAAFLLAPSTGAAGPNPATATQQPGPTYVYRVNAPLGDRAQDLLARGFDVLEQRDGNDLFVLGGQDAGQKLKEAGFTALVESVMEPPQWQPPSTDMRAAADVNETYYGGYHTINAHAAHLDQVASQRPDLATVVDYGDSWKKTQGAGGHDLRAICITKKNAGDCERRTDAPKPRFFVMGQLHAREITTGDMAWRWIDHLVAGYGTDSQVTSLLDTTEVWVVPIANPDGVDIVQSGGSSPKLQRKNANNTNGNCTSSGQIGIDLNRNTSSHFGGTGTSTNPCNETYKGPSADSEAETKALQSLWRSLYPDKRATGDTAPAANDTRGVVVSMHSYSNLVLFPWGWSTQDSGNDAPLRTMAKDMAQLAGGWQYGQPGEVLYNAAGATDDWVYDDLGVASFVWEIGAQSGSCSGFLPAYSCQTSTHWPKVKSMLQYAAGKAANPYGGGGGNPVPSCATKSNDTDLAIPDAGAAVDSTITIAGCDGNALSATKVDVHVQHTYRGDLRIELVAPDGSVYRLKTESSDSTPNLDTTYTVDVSGEARNGDWKLRVQDRYRADTGTLTGWTLTV